MPELDTVHFKVRPVPPFQLALTVWALRRRVSNIIDQFDGVTYHRTTIINGRPIGISVTQNGPPERRVLGVELNGNGVGSEDLAIAKTNLDVLLGVKIDLSSFYQTLSRTPKISDLLLKFKGVKPPRFPTIFEALVNAMSCQQLSLTVGLILINRLASKYGIKERDNSPSRAFPQPEHLSQAKPDALREFGYSSRQSGYIINLAKMISQGKIELEKIRDMSDESAMEYLQQIPGVGRWSSQYVLLRGLGRLHRFPADDVGARNGLMRLLGLRKKLDYDRTNKIIGAWQPYAGLMYFHLLLDRLSQEGLLSSQIS